VDWTTNNLVIQKVTTSINITKNKQHYHIVKIKLIPYFKAFVQNRATTTKKDAMMGPTVEG